MHGTNRRTEDGHQKTCTFVKTVQNYNPIQFFKFGS